MIERIFPTILILLQAFSSVPYFATGNWRMGCYWLFATGLTIVVTY